MTILILDLQGDGPLRQENDFQEEPSSRYPPDEALQGVLLHLQLPTEDQQPFEYSDGDEGSDHVDSDDGEYGSELDRFDQVSRRRVLVIPYKVGPDCRLHEKYPHVAHMPTKDPARRSTP